MGDAGIALVVFMLFGVLIIAKADIYIVTVEGEPVISYRGGVDGFEATAVESDEELDVTSEMVTSYRRHLEKKHDMLLGMLFDQGTYKKLYSYQHLINGFSVHISPEQAEALRCAPGVKSVERDWKVRRLTTHTPQFLGLPTGVWPTGGGFDRAGEDIVIGFVDSGIFPRHPSFGSHSTEPYGPLPKYRGKCEVDPDTKRDFCNGKIIGAQHFAEAAIAAGAFNPIIDFASPLDGDGHGSHTAAIAAGNNGIPVRMHGFEFGKASGMAPRARIAVYKALYRLFGGFVSDVVAAIEQAVLDGVDILNLSVGPNSPPATTKTTFLNPFDATLLAAVKAGVFVAQAAGNGGPFSKTVLSYSPWIVSVAAAVDDRRYKNHLTLGNEKILPGVGLSPATHANRTFTLVAANDVLLDSSVIKYSPSDCQKPEVLNKNLVEGNILLCGYSFNFVVGTASIKKVSETAKSLGAIGFVLAVESVSPGTKFDPVPVGLPGILITDVSKSMELIDYYNISTSRDWTGRVKSFKAIGSIGDGLRPILHKSAPQVALFSARGPNIKDYSFQDADLLKPDILAPGSLIWAAWSPNGTDEANYVGEGFAMISGTSMAAPHIAGISALVKQKHPHWSPAAIKSALMTTSTKLDRAERPLQAQQYSGSETMTLVPATPFDYGSGHVNPRAALDPGYQRPNGYFPFGVHGILSGSAAAFFSFVGFDAVTSTAEEVKNPHRDLPLGIGISVSTCCILYMLVSAVVVGLVPYDALDPDTPISSAFASYGMEWAVYIITTGTVTSLCAALMGSILPQPRILMAMARDGLLPSFLSDINKHTQVPVKSTILTGIFIAALSFFMDVSELAGMVSVGTLLGFTAVAISVLILRYVPPDEASAPSSLSESVNSVSLQFSSETQEICREHSKDSIRHPLLDKVVAQSEENELRRRKIASWSITLICTGILVLSSAASAEDLPSIPRLTFCLMGGALLLCCLIVLACTDQDDGARSFGQTGGFKCPFVPFLPVSCILINTYLLINLGPSTWSRVSVWLVVGALLYAFYGRTHSLLLNAVCVPTADLDDINCSSSRSYFDKAPNKST